MNQYIKILELQMIMMLSFDIFIFSILLVCIKIWNALVAPSHYLNQCWRIVNWTLGDKRQWNFNQNTKFFIHENAFENIVCEMVAILSRGRWVNGDLYMIVAADWTDGVCGCIYCNWNSIVKLYVKKRSGSILVQVITCWLMTPNHYLDQCWLIMTEVMGYLY